MCDCKVCIRGRNIQEHLERIEDPKEREFWEAVWLSLEMEELDHDVDKAIIDGVWPDSDKIIQERREYVVDRGCNKEQINESGSPVSVA